MKQIEKVEGEAEDLYSRDVSERFGHEPALTAWSSL